MEQKIGRRSRVLRIRHTLAPPLRFHFEVGQDHFAFKAYQGVSRLLKIKYGTSPRPTAQLTIVSSESKPFRQSPAEEKDLLRGCYEFITPLSGAGSVKSDGAFSAQVLADSLHPRDWHECTTEEGERLVMELPYPPKISRANIPQKKMEGMKF